MLRIISSRKGMLAVLLVSAGSLGVLGSLLSCGGGNSGPMFVAAPAVSGNVPPTLTITEPTEDLSVEQGTTFTISWTDSDRDSAATISFDLVSVANSAIVVPLVEGLQENDEGPTGLPNPESFTASTAVTTPGDYYIRGTIRDNLNAPVEAFASTGDVTEVRAVLTVTRTGFAPASTPPIVVVTEPTFNLSVAQDDALTITVSPTVDVVDPLNPPENPEPYDRDSEATLYILLDVDEDPTNDDPANPVPEEIIVLSQQTVLENEFEAITIVEDVDLGRIPVRTDGSPYFVRATIQDAANDAVHDYASGTIHVGQAASGSVDLGEVGRTLLGVTFRGFNPGANLGSRMITARDFDADGVDDMLLVAQFGNPRNFGNIGEAYLIYGLDQTRFGGFINVNSTSTDIPGVIFEAPPVRFRDDAEFAGLVSNPRTEGITDVATIGDLNGDGRPDLVFGLAHVDGVFQARDDDPADNPPERDDTVEVEIVLRQGFSETTIGNEDPFSGVFSGFEDTFIDSARPNQNFGGELDLEWDNDGPGERMWTLIRLRGLLDEIPDSASAVTELSASLEFRVVNSGEDASIHECLTEFTESSVTFNNFAVGGDEPEPGDPGDDEDIDYDEEELGSVGGNAGESTDVDITPLIQKLVDGELTDVGNDVLLILVPAEGGDDNMRLRSSEFSQVTDDRPTLTITYQRARFTGALGCYPDVLVNNVADEDDEDDALVEALGFVPVVHSDNRDNDGVLNPDRLESTVVSLELVGQENGLLLFDGLVTQRAEGEEGGRLSGNRFQVGAYDWIDHLLLDQPPLEALFGWQVDSIPDMDNDQVDEIIISAPNNEQDIVDLENGGFTPFSTHLNSRAYTGSIIVIPGSDYGVDFFRDKTGEEGCASIPANDHQLRVLGQAPSCSIQDPSPRAFFIPRGSFEVFAENPRDFLSGGRHAGDFNLDGVPDIMAGAPFNDSSAGDDAGASYVIYGRVPVGDYDLSLADNPLTRPPMLRVRGDSPNDQIGLRQERLGDVNGDRIADIVIASAAADFGGVARATCAADFDGDGDVDDNDLSTANFETCDGREAFLDDDCKAFDYNNDRMVDDADRLVLECLQDDEDDCCPVDNGFVGIIFGGVTIDGDRDISQIATSDLAGAQFWGSTAGERAGTDVASAGDFNQDGFDDILIAAPGRLWVDSSGQERLGVVYLIFGGPHLTNGKFSLSLVGSDQLPGIVFVSPYVAGRPSEAPPERVGFLGDINNDGFTDIAIGNTRADFTDESLPQDPDDPGTDPSTGRRPDSGDVYVIYGNNFGGNR